MQRGTLSAVFYCCLLTSALGAWNANGLLFGFAGLLAMAAWVCIVAYDYDNPQSCDSWLKPSTANPKWEYRYSVSPLSPTIYIRNICSLGDWKLDWHVIVGPDGDERYHSHPSTAYRLILWGGYVEELPNKVLRTWFPGRFGKVTPDFVHRVHAVNKSYSLWLRGPSTHKTKLIGSGW